MNDIARVGVVSSVDAKSGTAQIYYQDRDSTTGKLHQLAFGGEYTPLVAGQQVIVLHLSNDTSSGVILGRFWGESDPPEAEVDYRKNIGVETYIQLKNAVYTINSPEIQLIGKTGSMTLTEIIALERRVEALEKRSET